METIKMVLAPVKRISGEEGYQYFFGYYDNPAFSGDDRLHLCNRVGVRGRLPVSGDVSELGVIDLEKGGFVPIAETRAWNFQQGSMLQWYPGGSSTRVAYNDFLDGAYRSAVLDISTGERRLLDRPVASISPDGRWGLSINFSRVWDFRPGYGYCNLPDAAKDDPAPEDDGVFLVDMNSGGSRLLVSYRKMAGIFNTAPEYRGKKIVVNHITFNRSGDRFVLLVRCSPQGDGAWKTGVGTCDLSGNIYPLRPYAMASHYHWRDGKIWLFYGDAQDGTALYELEDETQSCTRIAGGFIHQDIHCSYSPDRRFIIGDGYPDAEGYRELFLYHLSSERGMRIGKFFSPAVGITDIRCDLHTRWSHSGSLISFDSTHEGFRGVYTMELGDILRGF